MFINMWKTIITEEIMKDKKEKYEKKDLCNNVYLSFDRGGIRL